MRSNLSSPASLERIAPLLYLSIGSTFERAPKYVTGEDVVVFFFFFWGTFHSFLQLVVTPECFRLCVFLVDVVVLVIVPTCDKTILFIDSADVVTHVASDVVVAVEDFVLTAPRRSGFKYYAVGLSKVKKAHLTPNNLCN